MTRGDLDRLRDAREHVQSALAVPPVALRDVWGVRERRQSLVFDLIVIGEALGGVSRPVQASASGIPWRAIRGTRNRLIHNYWRHDAGVIEAILLHELPSLGFELDRLIERMELFE